MIGHATLRHRLISVFLGSLALLWLLTAVPLAYPQETNAVSQVFLVGPDQATLGEPITLRVETETERTEISGPVLTVALPSGFVAQRIRSGYFETPATLEIEYTTNLDPNWRPSEFWTNLSRERTRFLQTSDLNLRTGEFVTQIRFIFDPVDSGLNTGFGRGAALEIDGFWLNSDFRGNRFTNGDTGQTCVELLAKGVSEACKTIELVSGQDRPEVDVSVWITPIGPEPLTVTPTQKLTLEIGGRLTLLDSESEKAPEALWFGVLLPAGWAYERGTYRLGSPAGIPPATEVFTEALDSGDTLFRVGWTSQLDEIIAIWAADPAAILSFAFDVTPAGTLKDNGNPIAALLHADGLIKTCWGGETDVPDRLDLDQDDDTAEELCSMSLGLPINPDPQLLAEPVIQTEGDATFAEIRLENRGNVDFETLSLTQTLPDGLQPSTFPAPLAFVHRLEGSQIEWQIDRLPAGEAITLTVPLAGNAPAQIWPESTLSAVWGAGDTFSQTLSELNAPAIFGASPAAQLILPVADRHDAPSGYPEAEHPIAEGLALGLIADTETAAFSTNFSNGDDANAIDDEDGILFRNNAIGVTGDTNNNLTAVVLNRTGETMRLYGWIDFNQDARFGDDERIIFGHRFGSLTNPQAEQFRFTVPLDAACGPTVARFRLSADSSLPNGPAGPGEVEDFVFTVQCTADLVLTSTPSASPIGRDETQHWLIEVTNLGPSLAEQVVFTHTIPNDTGYLYHTVDPDSEITCTEQEEIIRNAEIICTAPTLAAGETITADLAAVVPLIYPSETLTATASAGTLTVERDLSQNFINSTVTIEKAWILGDYKPVVDFAFTHVEYDDRLADNDQFREQDFRLTDQIPTLIQTPISIAFGFNANTTPFLTVSSCVVHPDDPTCNSNNIIPGLVIVESFTLTGIQSFETGEMVYQPAEPEQVFLNRIADSNLSRCGATGSCIGYDLFRVNRLNVFPYAWEPDDYFVIIPITKGGRVPECDPAARCILIEDAQPGLYQLQGEIQLQLFFDDRRIGDQPRINRLVPYEFTTTLQVIAPFLEPQE